MRSISPGQSTASGLQQGRSSQDHTSSRRSLATNPWSSGTMWKLRRSLRPYILEIPGKTQLHISLAGPEPSSLSEKELVALHSFVRKTVSSIPPEARRVISGVKLTWSIDSDYTLILTWDTSTDSSTKPSP